MKSSKKILLSRDVEGIQIPSGEPLSLKKGAEVLITQALGGSFTLLTDQGYMVRLAGRDADSIGEKVTESPKVTDSSAITREAVEKSVWDNLQTCFDPEIPVSIVELGLIYKCEVTPIEQGQFKVEIQMTLTAPGCGMGQILKDDVEEKVRRIPGVAQTQIDLVFDPPWDRDMMSEAAKLQLGMF